MTKKITFKEVAPSGISVGMKGWQLLRDEDGKYRRPRGMSRAEGKEFSTIVKGIRFVIRVANQEPEPKKAYDKMMKSFRNSDLIALAEGRGEIQFQDYSMNWGRVYGIKMK